METMALCKLAMLNRAAVLEDLGTPPGNRLEAWQWVEIPQKNIDFFTHRPSAAQSRGVKLSWAKMEGVMSVVRSHCHVKRLKANLNRQSEAEVGAPAPVRPRSDLKTAPVVSSIRGLQQVVFRAGR